VKILDWYILKRFIFTFLFTILLIVSIIVVIDYTEKNEDLVDLKFLFIVTEYYFNFIPYITNMISPLMIFIAAVFVTSRMAAHTEIVAILSSGVSFSRMLVPFIIGSTFVGIVSFWLGGWVIPRANKTRVAFENEYTRHKFNYQGKNIHFKVAPSTYAYFYAYNNDVNEGYQFTLETIEGRKMKSKLKADKIIWDSTKTKWKIENYTIRTIMGDGKEKITQGYAIDSSINITPRDFQSNYLLYETFTMQELNKYIALLKERGTESVEVYLTEKYERYTYPFSMVILTVIGVIVSAKKSREGPGYKIAFGFVLAFVYIIFVMMSRNLSYVGGIGPLLASWIPNIIFSGIGLIMYKTLPK